MQSAAKEDEEDTEDEDVIFIQGTSDALVSRGILALWIQTCQGVTVSTILEQTANPRDMADQWGLRAALSPGRNDGLASLVRTTRKLIQNLLLLKQKQKQPKEKEMGASAQVKDNNKTSTTIAAKQKKKTVALLLSGGVDSSVALHLLLQQGYDVTAFYLKIWLQDEVSHLGTCPWEDDVNMCKQVCEQAQVPLEIVSLQHEYQERVIVHTIEQAQLGRTPNPDILCNSRIKFGCFYEYLSKLQPHFDYVATGHYAQLVRHHDGDGDDDTEARGGGGARVRLLRAPDPIKDQSYFLCALTQTQLQRVLFPIGHLEKHQVRALAQDTFRLPNRHRPDSQGLCFLGKLKFGDFLRAYLGERPGDIVDAATGRVLGRHAGVWFHTVGQRKGIGPYLHPLATSQGPWYVVAKDPARDIVYCSNRYNNDDDDGLFDAPRSEFYVEQLSWIAGTIPSELLPPANNNSSGSGSDAHGGDNDDEFPTVRWDMKIRHGPRLVQGTVQLQRRSGGWGVANTDKNHNDEDSSSHMAMMAARNSISCCCRIRLDEKDGGLAPGQYVVFYTPGGAAGGVDDGAVSGECLGGGIISERHWESFLLLSSSTRQGGHDSKSHAVDCQDHGTSLAS